MPISAPVRLSERRFQSTPAMMIRAPSSTKMSSCLAVKRPADHRDQRNAHEIERHHQRGIAGAEGVAQAIMRRQAGGADAERGQNVARFEMQEHGEVAADQRQRKLDHRHPEHDAEGGFGHGQLLGGDHGDGVAECRASSTSNAAGLKLGDAGPQDHQHADQARARRRRGGSASSARAAARPPAARSRPAW